MLYDAIEVFEKKMKREAEKRQFDGAEYTDLEKEIGLLVDHYVPKNGTYVLINIDDGFSCGTLLEIQYDKKKNEIKGMNHSQYPYVRYLDFNSKLIEMNKPIDAKKIMHSNQLYSFWIKKESIAEKKLTKDIVDGYYDTIKNPAAKYTKPGAKALYRQMAAALGEPDCILIEKIREWVKKWLAEPEMLPVDYAGKDYLKLFFVYHDKKKTKECYEKENRRYVVPNIYNNNDYNVDVGGVILGMPSNNMGLNSKKPFLENKNRKTSAPYLIGMDRAILQSWFFDYLWGCACQGEVNVYIDFERKDIWAIPDKSEEIPTIETGLYLRIKKGKEVEILESDIVMHSTPNLARTFYYRRIVVGMDGKQYGEYNKVSALAAVIDEIFFDRMLSYNYFTDAMDMPQMDGGLKHTILTYRGRLFEWLYRNPQCNMRQVLCEMALKLIRNKIAAGYLIQAGMQLDLLLSLEEYFDNHGKQEEMMGTIQKAFKEHIDMHKNEWEFTDGEYYYAVGQMVGYFFSLSKSAKKPLSMANQFLTAENDALIKEKISQMFIRYDHAIDYDIDVRAKNIISHIMMYEPKCGRVMQRELIAGLTASSAFYAKKED